METLITNTSSNEQLKLSFNWTVRTQTKLTETFRSSVKSLGSFLGEHPFFAAATVIYIQPIMIPPPGLITAIYIPIFTAMSVASFFTEEGKKQKAHIKDVWNTDLNDLYSNKELPPYLLTKDNSNSVEISYKKLWQTTKDDAKEVVSQILGSLLQKWPQATSTAVFAHSYFLEDIRITEEDLLTKPHSYHINQTRPLIV